MILLDAKLKKLKNRLTNKEKLRIAIFGLGSVGNYLLTYLLSHYDNEEIFIVGRNKEKMESDVNIAKVAVSIRLNHYPSVSILEADFKNTDQLASVINQIQPDFIINSSRAYSHIKYGSISWNNIRAYGIWTPLSVMHIKNIMIAVRLCNLSPIIINTSYPDATNAWLKTGGFNYPDFGSGNLNHLIPKIKLAVANEFSISDINNIEVTLCTSHFHDVLISKEGITLDLDPLINISYLDQKLNIDNKKVYSECTIVLPNDERRNMMNASSNFEIIFKIIESIKNQSNSIIHSPGFCGMVGGYPIELNFSNTNNSSIKLFDKYFSITQMEQVNLDSIYQDGIESVKDGKLTYSNELISKTAKAFNYQLPKIVDINDSNEVANEIIQNIIEKFNK